MYHLALVDVSVNPQTSRRLQCSRPRSSPVVGAQAQALPEITWWSVWCLEPHWSPTQRVPLHCGIVGNLLLKLVLW